MKNRVLTILTCLIVGSVARSQDYYFRHYQVENGLSHNSVLCSLQDKRGFMWFGTKDGLNRFDGYNFKWFQNNPADTSSIGSNLIQCLQEFKGCLWAGTDNGLFRYNECDETFRILAPTINKPIRDIENDNQGNLWFVAGTTLYKYSVKTEEFQTFNEGDFFEAASITKSKNGQIWAASFRALYRYLPRKNTFEKEKVDIVATKNLPVNINIIQARGENQVLIGTQNQGAFIYHTSGKKTEKLFNTGKEPLFVRNFIQKGKNIIWLATETGIYIYNIKDKSLKNLQKSFNSPYAVSDNAIYALSVDNEGAVWAGTYFGGINYYPKQYTPFKKYFPKLGENSISGKAIREIHKDDYGNLWIGTEDEGLNKFNPNTGEFTVFKHGKSSGSIAYNNIHGLLPKGDKLWVGTFEHGLDIFDIKSGKVVKHYGTDILKSNFVYTFYEREDHKILIFTTLGIQQYNPEEDAILDYKPFPEAHFFNSFLEDKDGMQWAGTYREGLYRYNPETKSKTEYKNERGNKNSISSNAINGIFEDSNGSIWISTEKGLNLYDPEKDQFQRFTVQNGLPSNVVYSILEGENGTLWISTSNGLVEFYPETHKIKVFNKSNGLLNNQFNYNSAYQDENGNMYFGSVGGLISFNPGNFIKNIYRPAIYITGLQINNKEAPVDKEKSPLTKSITFTRQIELKNDQSTFTLDFAALSYTAPGTTQYWYKLKGLNDQWIPLGEKHQVSFTELPSGSYTFQVKSLNKSGLWSRNIASLQIGILPVFWASNLAYIIYFLFGVSLLFVIFKYYHDRIKNRNNRKIEQFNTQKEREIYQAKIDFFTNVAHEIRTPLTLIKSPLERLLKRTNKSNEQDIRENLNIMEKNTSRLLNLVNQVLDFRKTGGEGVQLKYLKTNISDLIKETHTRFSPAIKERNIDFFIRIKDKNIIAEIDEEAVKKIVSNLFNNAIKYSDKKVVVTLLKDKESFKLIVENDGELIPKSSKIKIFEPFFRLPNTKGQTGTGIGLSLAHSLAVLHEGSLKFSSTARGMNTFILILPLYQDEENKSYSAEKGSTENTTITQQTEKPSPENNYTILIVEDNKDLLSFMSKDLREKYHVLEASNAEGAFEIIKKENIHLIISDVMMPGIDGFTLCKTLKTQLETSHIPLLLLTAKSGMDSRVEGLESGADVYISKPFSTENLLAQIKSLLENRRYIMEYYSKNPLSHLNHIASTKTDKVFIKKLNTLINESISDPNLNVDMLAESMNMSRSTLYRKIKDISDLSPNDLINITRLKKAAELLKTGKYKIYEVADSVGYKSQTSFGRSFQKQFNMTPRKYMKK